MPRKRKHKGKKKRPPDYPAVVTENSMDSGETVDPADAPIDVKKVFDDDNEVSGDEWGGQNPDSFFTTPPAPGDPNIPEPAGSQPQETEYVPPRLAGVDFEGGDHVMFGPITEPNVVDDRRIHLTWIVNEVRIRMKSADGMPLPELLVKAILCVAVYDMIPIANQERKEPMLNTVPLMKEPVELAIPIWLLPPELAANPDKISLSLAEKLLAQMFASFPTEIIKTPPPPAAMEKFPDWLAQQIKEQKGPVRP